MTERDFEQQLRAGLRQMLDQGAPSALRATVIAIPDVVSPNRQRWLTGGWRFPPMNRFAPVALIAAVVILILVGVGLFVRSPNVGPQPPAPTASPEPSSSDRIGAIAYVTGEGLNPLYLLLPDEEPRQLAPSDTVENTVVCPSFSPDGTMLAFGMRGGTILVMPIDDQGHTGDPVRLDGQASETPHCAAWAPDSSAVAFLDDSALVIVPLAGGPQRIEGWDTGNAGDPFAIDYPGDRAVQWSPDGSVIAVARPSGTWLIPTDGGAPRRLHETPANTVSWSPDGTRLVVGAVVIVVIGVADGTTLAQLPSGGGPPMWSPVEDRIAFVDVDAAGLVVVRPDGSDPIVIDNYGYHPTWSSDGRQLIYRQDASFAAWRLMLADATGSGEPTMIVEEVAIYSARSFPAAEQITWQPVER